MGLTLVVGLSAGCDTDSLTDVNRNPNAPEVVDAQYLMPALIQESVNTVLGTEIGQPGLGQPLGAALRFARLRL